MQQLLVTDEKKERFTKQTGKRNMLFSAESSQRGAMERKKKRQKGENICENRTRRKFGQLDSFSRVDVFSV